MTREMVWNKAEQIEEYLRNNGVFCTAYPYHTDIPVVEVEINWGDWKHDHLRADWLMEELGVSRIKTEVTEENGSDCYSAIHYYYVREMN